MFGFVSLRDFLRLENREQFPIIRGCRRTRGRLHMRSTKSVFGWVLKLVAEQGWSRAAHRRRNASTMEANAALRTIVRRMMADLSRNC